MHPLQCKGCGQISGNFCLNKHVPLVIADLGQDNRCHSSDAWDVAQVSCNLRRPLAGGRLHAPNPFKPCLRCVPLNI
eukprot:1154497-Pelagomonas_calceolata.AAC.2